MKNIKNFILVIILSLGLIIGIGFCAHKLVDWYFSLDKIVDLSTSRFAKVVENLPKGTKVYCSNCGKLLYKTNRILKSGDIVDADDFMSINTKIPKPINGELMNCYYCGQFFVFTTIGSGCRMKTDKGIWP